MQDLPRSDRDGVQLSDDETTDPIAAAFNRALAAMFRCPGCELELTLPDAVSTAPRCVDCDRFMVPVNAPKPRGQA